MLLEKKKVLVEVGVKNSASEVETEQKFLSEIASETEAEPVREEVVVKNDRVRTALERYDA